MDKPEIMNRLELLYQLYLNYDNLRKAISNGETVTTNISINHIRSQINIQLNILYGLTGLGLRELICYYFHNHNPTIPRNRLTTGSRINISESVLNLDTHLFRHFTNRNNQIRSYILYNSSFNQRNFDSTLSTNNNFFFFIRYSDDQVNDRSSYLHNSLFHFNQYQRITFDLEKDNLEIIFDKIRKNFDYEIFYDTIYQNNYAYGNGANREVYSRLCNELVNTLMVKTHPYFMDINLENDFWNEEENIKTFVVFLAMAVNSECILTYHLSPALLECITYKQLEISELEFFMEKIDPELYHNIKKINNEDFTELDIGYSTIEKYYRNKIVGDLPDKKLEIYQSIAKHFELFTSFNDYTILAIDKIFSGEYEITAKHIQSIIKLNNEEYQNKWNVFVQSLTETELKQMLILFGNSLSLDTEYSMNVFDMDVDIKISVCCKSININAKLFEKPEYLDGLKNYFKNNDIISDEIRYPENRNSNLISGHYDPTSLYPNAMRSDTLRPSNHLSFFNHGGIYRPIYTSIYVDSDRFYRSQLINQYLPNVSQIVNRTSRLSYTAIVDGFHRENNVEKINNELNISVKEKEKKSILKKERKTILKKEKYQKSSKKIKRKNQIIKYSPKNNNGYKKKYR